MTIFEPTGNEEWREDPWTSSGYHEDNARDYFTRAVGDGSEPVDHDLLAIAQFHATMSVKRTLVDLYIATGDMNSKIRY